MNRAPINICPHPNQGESGTQPVTAKARAYDIRKLHFPQSNSWGCSVSWTWKKRLHADYILTPSQRVHSSSEFACQDSIKSILLRLNWRDPRRYSGTRCARLRLAPRSPPRHRGGCTSASPASAWGKRESVTAAATSLSHPPALPPGGLQVASFDGETVPSTEWQKNWSYQGCRNTGNVRPNTFFIKC